MLTIKNVESVYRRDVGSYRIAKVITSPGTYLFTMRKSNGAAIVVTLVRTGIEDEDCELEYNMWCSKDGKLESLNFSRIHFLTPDAFLSALSVLII